MKKTTLLPVCAALCLLAGCRSSVPDLPGDWVLVTEQRGWGRIMSLEPDGSAHAANFPNTILEAWQLQDRQLILSGKIVYHGQPVAFSDTLTIDRSSSADTLVLTNGELTQRFRRL